MSTIFVVHDTLKTAHTQKKRTCRSPRVRRRRAARASPQLLFTATLTSRSTPPLPSTISRCSSPHVLSLCRVPQPILPHECFISIYRSSETDKRNGHHFGQTCRLISNALLRRSLSFRFHSRRVLAARAQNRAEAETAKVRASRLL